MVVCMPVPLAVRIEPEESCCKSIDQRHGGAQCTGACRCMLKPQAELEVSPWAPALAIIMVDPSPSPRRAESGDLTVREIYLLTTSPSGRARPLGEVVKR